MTPRAWRRRIQNSSERGDGFRPRAERTAPLVDSRSIVYLVPHLCTRNPIGPVGRRKSPVTTRRWRGAVRIDRTGSGTGDHLGSDQVGRLFSALIVVVMLGKGPDRARPPASQFLFGHSEVKPHTRVARQRRVYKDKCPLSNRLDAFSQKDDTDAWATNPFQARVSDNAISLLGCSHSGRTARSCVGRRGNMQQRL